MDINEKALYANQKKELKGLDGWLGLFQIWALIFVIMYGVIVFDPALRFSAKIIYGVILALLAACMVLFYMRKMVFRLLYIIFISVDFGIEVLIAILTQDASSILYPEKIFLFASEIAIAVALFKSKRVSNTFR